MKTEINIPPQDFQDRLTLVGGVNRYDEPNFKIAWAQYETFTAGGVWSVDEKYFKGYRQLLSGSGEPCWTVFQWHPAEDYGSPEAFYVANYDDVTGLQLLGEYPYSGKYEVLYNLRWNEIENGKITFFTLPLNNTLLDLIIPVILKAKDVSLEKRRAVLLEAKSRRDAEETGIIESHLRSNALPFNSTVSYTRQGIRSSIIDKKMLALQQNMQQIAQSAKGMKKGLSTK
jgi:hypothetical protein